MPNTASAKKALGQDRRRAIQNLTARTQLKRALKSVNSESLSQTVSFLDKAVKRNLIHKNRVARIKARLSKTLGIAKSKRAGAASKKRLRAKA
ncbi:30S ribosomal protein S20 [Candidatus Berkelbacteria bacterium]|nr:30S ribosomal protein S20 [Candidatus Berkelbacteria bacterium]